MKALKGSLAKRIQLDPQGRLELQRFIASGEASAVITLSNGKSYRVYSK